MEMEEKKNKKKKKPKQKLHHAHTHTHKISGGNVHACNKEQGEHALADADDDNEAKAKQSKAKQSKAKQSKARKLEPSKDSNDNGVVRSHRLIVHTFACRHVATRESLQIAG